MQQVQHSKFAKKVYLACSKWGADKVDIDKLETIPLDLIELNNVVKMILLKRLCMINWLKKLMLFRLLILAIYLKKHTATQKW